MISLLRDLQTLNRCDPLALPVCGSSRNSIFLAAAFMRWINLKLQVTLRSNDKSPPMRITNNYINLLFNLELEEIFFAELSDDLFVGVGCIHLRKNYRFINSIKLVQIFQTVFIFFLKFFFC